MNSHRALILRGRLGIRLQKELLELVLAKQLAETKLEAEQEMVQLKVQQGWWRPPAPIAPRNDDFWSGGMFDWLVPI